jgi:hypothetical protein
MATWLLMAILPFERQLRSAQRATANEQAMGKSARRPTSADESDFSLKGQERPPFIHLGRIRPERSKPVPEPVGAIGASTAVKYAVAVTRQEQDQQDLQGRQAVQLIQSATAPQLATSGSVGTKLNVVG